MKLAAMIHLPLAFVAAESAFLATTSRQCDDAPQKMVAIESVVQTQLDTFPLEHWMIAPNRKVQSADVTSPHLCRDAARFLSFSEELKGKS